MTKRHIILILIALLVLVGLSVVNLFMLIKSQSDTRSSIQNAITNYQEFDQQRTEKLIEKAMKEIKTMNNSVVQQPQAGAAGVPGKDGQSIKGDKGDAGPAGQPGKDGAPGKDGKNARPIIMNADPATGDIMWKYDGDTLWTLLIEKCQLLGNCN